MVDAQLAHTLLRCYSDMTKLIASFRKGNDEMIIDIHTSVMEEHIEFMYAQLEVLIPDTILEQVYKFTHS